tara:strand:+ start:957 stop:1136 length:180 start_codon:yes stop_codon:yes gene_type:complete
MFTHPDRQILQFITEGLELLDQHASTKGNFEKVLRIREIKAEIEELVPQSNNGRRKYIN